MANKRSSPVSTIIIVLLIVGVGVFFGTKLIHRCDSCGEIFFGTGYEANELEQAAGQLLGKKDTEDPIYCKDCAEESCSLFGIQFADVDDYKRPLF